MSKVIMFSRNFPKTHPKAGVSTGFVDKIWKWYYDSKNGDVRDLSWYTTQYDNVFDVVEPCQIQNVHELSPKLHTIRGGQRFKAGDFFSPRIWTGKPYTSKQLEIAPLIEVKQVFPIRILVQDFGAIGLQSVVTINGKNFTDIELLAKNDGLSVEDFLTWFHSKKGEAFEGQIICWSEDVCY